MSWKKFGIDENILKAIEELGFSEPTAIQKAVLPKAVKNKCDVFGAAETGSGKTLAFGVPLLMRVLEEKKVAQKMAEEEAEEVMEVEDVNYDEVEQNEESDGDLTPDEEEAEFYWKENEITPDISLLVEEIQPNSSAQKQGEMITIKENSKKPSDLKALVLCPTRELAVQVGEHLKQLAKYTDISIATIFGGIATQKQERVLLKKPDVIVATPGRLWHFLDEGEAHLCGAPFIKAFVIDEADRMMEKGHFEELHNTLQYMNADKTAAVEGQRQTMVFSATLLFQLPESHHLSKNANKKKSASKMKQLEELVGLSPSALMVDISKSKVESLKEYKIFCSDVEDKDLHLYSFLRDHPGRTLIFCNSKDAVRRLKILLNTLNMRPSVVHSTMNQKNRLKNSERFKSDPQSVLLASDVAARGWDIPDVKHVIQYDIPTTAEVFLHRSGRTARANRCGLCLLLVAPKEVKQFRRILFNLKRQETEIPFLPLKEHDTGKYRKVVDIAKKIVQQEIQVDKKRHKLDWFAKAAAETDIALDSDMEEEITKFKHEKSSVNNQLKTLKHQLTEKLKQMP